MLAEFGFGTAEQEGAFQKGSVSVVAGSMRRITEVAQLVKSIFLTSRFASRILQCISWREARVIPQLST